LKYGNFGNSHPKGWLFFLSSEGRWPWIQVWNAIKNICIAEEVETAESFAERLKGLLGRRSLPAGKGLLIRPCNSIHSCFMRFSFDAVFINSDLKVVYLTEKMRPFRISPVVRDAEMVLELPAGTISRTGTEIGDLLFIDKGDGADRTACIS